MFKIPESEVTEHFIPRGEVPYLSTCFVAGTAVRAIDGPRAIETLRVGDQVLSQAETTGALAFQPVLGVHHNEPGGTLRVALDDGTTVVSSVYHRFWRAGSGWAMARELKAGDRIRTLGGQSRITSIAMGTSEPLYNLDVAENRTFFAGKSSVLVHDNSVPDSRLRPFDAEPSLTASGASTR